VAEQEGGREREYDALEHRDQRRRRVLAREESRRERLEQDLCG